MRRRGRPRRLVSPTHPSRSSAHDPGRRSPGCPPARTRRSVRRYWDGRFDEKDDDVVDAFFPPGEDVQQQEAWLDDFHAAWDDTRVSRDQLVAEDDLVVVHCTCVATHVGEWEGVAPSGRRLRRRGMALCGCATARSSRTTSSTARSGPRCSLGPTPPDQTVLAPPAASGSSQDRLYQPRVWGRWAHTPLTGVVGTPGTPGRWCRRRRPAAAHRGPVPPRTPVGPGSACPRAPGRWLTGPMRCAQRPLAALISASRKRVRFRTWQLVDTPATSPDDASKSWCTSFRRGT